MKKTPIKQSFKFKYLVALAVVLVLGVWLYTRLSEKLQIALLSEGTQGCISNVTSFSAKNPCQTGVSDTYSSFSYTCNNRNSADYQIDSGKCTSFAQAFREVTKLCGKTCPTSKPTPTPPPGCYYDQSRCELDANGEQKCLGTPTLICPPSPTPDQRICTQAVGTCMGKDYSSDGCVSYKNGCEQDDKCAKPIKSCTLSTSKPTPTPPPGCYYKSVQCIKAPCAPILVCPSPTPTPKVCAQVVGTCIGKPTGGTTSTCVSYKDGCEQTDFCAKPIKTCPISTPKPTPPPGCHYEQSRCEMDAQGKQRCLGTPVLVCPPSPTPTPRACTQAVGTCIAKPMAGLPAGAFTTCISYKDGCEQTDKCATPVSACPTNRCTRPIMGRSYCFPKWWFND